MQAAFQEYLKIDRLLLKGDYPYTSPLLTGEIFNKEKMEYSLPLSASEEYLQRISQRRSFDWLKDCPDYLELIKNLKSQAIPYTVENPDS